jgi:hypothetical protein
LLAYYWVWKNKNTARFSLVILFLILKLMYKNFYFEDAQNAFNLGVRSPITNDFIHLTVPTYMKWLRQHKDLVWEARSRVDKGENPKAVPHFRPEPKLLK